MDSRDYEFGRDGKTPKRKVALVPTAIAFVIDEEEVASSLDVVRSKQFVPSVRDHETCDATVIGENIDVISKVADGVQVQVHTSDGLFDRSPGRYLSPPIETLTSYDQHAMRMVLQSYAIMERDRK